MATREQLEDAFLQADAAGDTESAQLFADELARLGQEAEKQTQYQAVMAGDVDKEAGAPGEVRLAVAQAQTPEDKLATIQQYYPDAIQIEDNYVFTDPRTGRQTLYNPEGFDLGDVVEQGRIIPEIIGGVAGGAAAGAAGSAVPVAGTAAGILTGAAVGSEAGGQAWDYVMRRMLPVIDTRSITQVIGDAAINTGINYIGGKAGEMAGKILSKFGSTIRRGTGKPVSEVIEAAEQVGTELPLGSVSGNKAVQKVEETLANIPTSSGILGEQYAKTIDDMGTYAIDAARQLTDIEGAYDVGTSVIKGVDSYIEKFKSESSELYDELWEAMPQDTRVHLPETKGLLDEITTKFKDDQAFEEILGSKKLNTFKKAVDESADGVTMGTLKVLRTSIGSQLENANLIDDAAGAELKKLYGALSDDLELAALKQGDEAYSKWEAANSFYREGRDVIDNVLQPTVKGGVAERVYSKIFGQEGQVLRKPNLDEISNLMDAMPDSAKKDIEGEFVRRMGLASPGVQDETGELFSPARFLTNWNRLSDGVKDKVFGKQSREALENLSTISATIKDRAKVANTSGTAAPIIGFTLLMDALGGSGGAATTAALSSIGAAKLMTNKSFVKWLTKTASEDATAETFGRNLGLLYSMAEAQPAIRSEIYQYAKALEGYKPIPEEIRNQTPYGREEEPEFSMGVDYSMF